MSEGERGPWRRTVRFALVAFAVLSLLPVWPAWYIGSWEANGEFASFWTMLASLPRAFEQVSASKLVLRYYGPDLIPPVALMGVVLLVGRWWTSRLRGASFALGRWGVRFLALGLFLLSAALLATLGR